MGGNAKGYFAIIKISKSWVDTLKIHENYQFLIFERLLEKKSVSYVIAYYFN